MFARTPRLLLRPGWMEDAPALAAAIGDPAVLRNLTHAPAPYGLADAQAYLAHPHQPQQPQEPRLLAFTRTKGAPKLVGGCGVHRADDGTAELGFWIARPYWGLGFATEAARAVTQMVHAAGLRGLRALHFADNPASGNVLRKLGFRPTGRIEQRFSLARGGIDDCFAYEQSADPCPAADSGSGSLRNAAPALAA